MNKKLLMASALVAALSGNFAWADHHDHKDRSDKPGADWISEADLKKSLEKDGYTVKRVEADDGHWEGKLNKDGKRFEFHADAKTGKITKLKSEDD